MCESRLGGRLRDAEGREVHRSHGSRPVTSKPDPVDPHPRLAHRLSDSPAGLLAWLLERWNAWSDNGGDVESVFTKDDMLTHAKIYWASNAIAPSMRYYANANRYTSCVTYENPPGIHTADERIQAFKTGPQIPDEWTDDLRRTLRGRRPASSDDTPPDGNDRAVRERSPRSGRVHTNCAAAWPDAQAHWKLKPPRWPVTSSTSPMKYRPGLLSDSMVLDDTSRVWTPPRVTSAVR
ncbi:hypothetical protein DSM104299_00190 [Baekduia alba]|nr:hypothetical protein DSM104299_00190 [Baekduia alba]